MIEISIKRKLFWKDVLMDILCMDRLKLNLRTPWGIFSNQIRVMFIFTLLLKYSNFPITFWDISNLYHENEDQKSNSHSTSVKNVSKNAWGIPIKK